MPDPSGTRFAALTPQLKRRVGLASLLIAGGVLSLGAQAQPVSGGNQAAVQAGVQAAVQDGIQTIRTARIQKAQGPIKAHQSTPAHRFDQSTLVAQANSNGGAATRSEESAVQAADQP